MTLLRSLGVPGVRSSEPPGSRTWGKLSKNVSACISAASLHGHYVLLSISADICSGDKRLGNKCALQQIKLAVRKSCSSRELINPIKTLRISQARERWVFRVL